MEFKSAREGMASPLAKRLFGIDGVQSVFFGGDFVTVSETVLPLRSCCFNAGPAAFLGVHAKDTASGCWLHWARSALHEHHAVAQD